MLVNTATDRGNAGPDYYYGWGVMNVKAAAEGKTSFYLRFQLQSDANNNSYGWSIDDLKVSGIGGAAYPPAFTSTPPASSFVGETFAYAVTCSDPDSPVAGLSLAATGLPAGLTFVDHGDGAGTLAGTPTEHGAVDHSYFRPNDSR